MGSPVQCFEILNYSTWGFKEGGSHYQCK